MSQTARLLAVLRDGPATNREIHERAGHMVVNSRVAGLRDKGYVIDCEYVGGTGAGAYLYTLVSEPSKISGGPDGALRAQRAERTDGTSASALAVANTAPPLTHLPGHGHPSPPAVAGAPQLTLDGIAA